MYVDIVNVSFFISMIKLISCSLYQGGKDLLICRRKGINVLKVSINGDIDGVKIKNRRPIKFD